MLDLHSHIVPEIDDGSVSLEVTKDMLINAYNEGTRCICATSHYISGDFQIQKEIYDEKFLSVSKLGEEIGIQVVKGLEVYLTPNLLELYKEGKIWCINEKNYMLIELPMREIPLYTEDVLYNLRLCGVTPIIAHPERNFKIANNLDVLKDLLEQGNLAQINAGSLTGLYGSAIKETALKLVEKNMIHFIGSDAHNNGNRDTSISSGINQIKKINQDLFLWIVDNEEKILSGEGVYPLEIKNEKKKGFLSRLFKK
ncbi:phosphoesterase [Clostridium polyendosporum]|uniref:protein-tyrosine-phosphatase n=1 Tax=Clostridium polyendosporum TaxID=69208 RepID=A0A919S149_9CLOT|nr:CpsB/CapC family capsule biosynthesis tyrosine phosphatase [Clostridium polyendosporum]GIM28703.1 phosphoesterase [Clostridium polyendosporum]